MKKQIRNKRIDWIDTLKGIGMFLVIWGHTFKSKSGIIKKYIYSFHMPMFFFASGLTFDDSCKLSLKDYTKKKFKSLILPYFIISIICYLLLLTSYKLGLYNKFYYFKYIIGIFYSNGKFLPMPVTYLWFVPTLFFTEIIFYALRKYIKDDYKLFLTMLTFGIIGYVNSISEYKFPGLWHLETMFISIVFYYTGYMFIKITNKFKSFFDCKPKLFICGLLLGIIGIFTMYNNGSISMHTNKYGSIILFYISSLSTIFALIFFINLFFSKDRVFKTIGRNSIFFLSYHAFVINAALYFFPKSNTGNLNIFITALATTIILFPCSIITKKYFPIFYGKLKKH